MRNKASGLLIGMAAAAAALLLSGCGSDTAGEATTSTSTTTITSSAADTTPATSSESSVTPSTTITATTTEAPPSSSAPVSTTTSTATTTAMTTVEPPPPSSSDTEEVDGAHCLSKNLTVTLGDPEGAAGSTFYTLIFANYGPEACTLDGHPGVSFVGGDDGHQIGASAAMDDTTANTLVTIQSGAYATAQLKIAQAGNYDAATCSPETARGLRIYPPDETASIYVEQSLDACGSDGVNLLTIGSVTSA